MVGITRPRTFRDVAFIFLGAAAMHFTTVFLGPLSFTEHTSSIIVNTQVRCFASFCGTHGVGYNPDADVAGRRSRGEVMEGGMYGS